VAGVRLPAVVLAELTSRALRGHQGRTTRKIFTSNRRTESRAGTGRQLARVFSRGRHLFDELSAVVQLLDRRRQVATTGVYWRASAGRVFFTAAWLARTNDGVCGSQVCVD